MLAFEKKPELIIEKHSFQTVLDSTCELLKEKHVEFSIRRIREMDEELQKFEKELDEFLAKRLN